MRTVSPWELGNNALLCGPVRPRAPLLGMDAALPQERGLEGVSWAPAVPPLCPNRPTCAGPSTMAGSCHATLLIFVITLTPNYFIVFTSLLVYWLLSTLPPPSPHT